MTRSTQRPPDGAATTQASLEERLAAIELRLTHLEGSLHHVVTVAEQAAHLAGSGRADEDELKRLVEDVRRMAGLVWDEAAVTRRLARIEDVLGVKDEGGEDRG